MSTPTGEAITAAGLEALRADLHELETTGRQKMGKRIEAARDLGDLKENAEYHIAKEDQALLETKILRLRERLRNAVIVEADATTDEFAFGRTARVRDEATGKEHTWTIVGATEQSLAKGKLSAESPVGRALLGRRAGDVVSVETPGGARRYVVVEVLASG